MNPNHASLGSILAHLSGRFDDGVPLAFLGPWAYSGPLSARSSMTRAPEQLPDENA